MYLRSVFLSLIIVFSFCFQSRAKDIQVKSHSFLEGTWYEQLWSDPFEKPISKMRILHVDMGKHIYTLHQIPVRYEKHAVYLFVKEKTLISKGEVQMEWQVPEKNSIVFSLLLESNDGKRFRVPGRFDVGKQRSELMLFELSQKKIQNRKEIFYIRATRPKQAAFLMVKKIKSFLTKMFQSYAKNLKLKLKKHAIPVKIFEVGYEEKNAEIPYWPKYRPFLGHPVLTPGDEDAMIKIIQAQEIKKHAKKTKKKTVLAPWKAQVPRVNQPVIMPFK